ncbi:MAG: alpha/beta fold hydrolase, partial [Candidatus Binatia bacterium]
LFIHSRNDPRSEPDELEGIRRDCPQARMHVVESGGHSPHSEKKVFAECNAVAGEFLREIKPGAERARRASTG